MMTLEERRTPADRRPQPLPAVPVPHRHPGAWPAVQRSLGNDFLHRLARQHLESPGAGASAGRHGLPLAADTRRLLEPHLGADFGDVRVHTDAMSTMDLRADAYTVGTDVVFAPGRYRPDTGAGLRLLAHELTHVVQQRRGGPVRVQAQRPGSWMVDPEELEADLAAGGLGRRPRRAPWMNISDTDVTRLLDCIASLGPLHRADCYDMVLGHRLAGEVLDRRPLTERLELEVHEIQIDPGWPAAIGRFFGKNPSTPPAVPTGQRVIVGNSVDGQYAKGAEAAGAWLLDQIARAPNPARPFLPADRTLNMAVAAIGQVLRFTRIGAPVLLVEQVGPITPAVTTATNVPVTDTSFTVSGHRYKLGPTWMSNDYAKLRAVLDLFPASALPPDNTVFRRAPVLVCAPGTPLTTCNPRWAAKHHYDSAARQHVIEIYDSAFTEHARRDGTWPVLYTDIAHEIGHAHDYEPLARAMNRFNTPGTGTLAQRKARLLAARSGSGRRYVEGSSTPTLIRFNVTDDPTGVTGDYRKAAIADGLRVDAAGKLSHGITDYSEEAWAENYAESFSIYLADPDLLRTLRPTVYAYFAARFPR